MDEERFHRKSIDVSPNEGFGYGWLVGPYNAYEFCTVHHLMQRGRKVGSISFCGFPRQNNVNRGIIREFVGLTTFNEFNRSLKNPCVS